VNKAFSCVSVTLADWSGAKIKILKVFLMSTFSPTVFLHGLNDNDEEKSKQETMLLKLFSSSLVKRQNKLERLFIKSFLQ